MGFGNRHHLYINLQDLAMTTEIYSRLKEKISSQKIQRYLFRIYYKYMLIDMSLDVVKLSKINLMLMHVNSS